MESVSGVRCGIAQSGSCGVGNRARQDFARGMHRHVALSRDNAKLALLQGTVTGYRLRIPSQGTSYRVLARGTDMGLCYVGIATSQHHSGI